MMRRATLPTVTAMALLLPACAQVLQAAWSPPSRDPAHVSAGTYKVDPNHTQIIFSVMHMGFTNYYGHFSGVSGSLAVVPKQPATMVVSVSIPVTSVTTTSTVLDGELKSADWLDAKRYPAMSFRSSKVTPTGADTADVEGMLSLHGVSKPVTLHATFNGAGVNMLDHKQTVGFQATGTLKRSDFGVTKYVPLIGDEVTMTIAAAFEKG